MWRLVKQVQNKRKLQSLRNKFGVVISDPDSIAQEISQFWQRTMSLQGPLADMCSTYLSKFFQGKDVQLMAKALIKPLSIDLVHAALSNFNTTSSPGFDGIPCSVYAAFANVFAPAIFEIISNFHASETISDSWALAPLNVIPKARGTVTVGT